MRRPAQSLTCRDTEIVLFVMLGHALKRLPPEQRKISVDFDEVEQLRRGIKWPSFRVGFGIDEKKYKKLWRTIWNSTPPDLKYEPKPEKTRVFNL